MSLKDRVAAPKSIIDMGAVNLAWIILEDLRPYEGWNRAISLHTYPANEAAEFGHVMPELVRKLELSIAEAMQWLLFRGLLVFAPGGSLQASGLVKISLNGESIKDEAAFRKFVRADVLNLDTLHPRLLRKVVSHFRDGEYDTAVFQAFKEVEKAARGAAKMPPSSHGSGLLERAFKPKLGPIADSTLEDEEQVRDQMLVVGAFKRYRNASGHRDVDYDDIVEVAEIITLASLILRKIEERA